VSTFGGISLTGNCTAKRGRRYEVHGGTIGPNFIMNATIRLAGAYTKLGTRFSGGAIVVTAGQFVVSVER